MYKSVDTVEEVNEAVPSRRAGMSGGRTETSGLYGTQTPQLARTVYSCFLCWRSAALRSGDWLALGRAGFRPSNLTHLSRFNSFPSGRFWVHASSFRGRAMT